MSYLSINIIVSSVSLSELASGTFSETVFPIRRFHIFMRCYRSGAQERNNERRDYGMKTIAPLLLIGFNKILCYASSLQSILLMRT